MGDEPHGNVLVLGDSDLAGLAVVRSLGRAKLNVHLACFENKPMARHSRYVSQRHDLGHPLVDPARFVDNLLLLLQDRNFDLVIPTSDKSLVTLMPVRDEIRRHARFAAPDADGFRITNHKDETFRLARELEVDIPDTQILAGPADLATFHTPVHFPAVLKPSSSVTAGQVRRHQVRIVHSADELIQRLPDMLKRGPVLIQEFCPGKGAGLGVLADRGELVAAFQYARVHEPPQGGASTYRQSVPLSNELLDVARKMCGAMRWTGPAMFEFKVDPTTGRAVLMEINGRLWGSLALSIQAGVDFPKLMYDLLVLGRCAPTFEYKTPYFVRHTYRDLFWLWSNLRTPSGRDDLIKVGLTDVFKEMANIIRLREGYDLESLSDPLPALVAVPALARELVEDVRRNWMRHRSRRLAARLARRIRQGDRRLTQQLHAARSVLFVCRGNINRSAVAARRLNDRMGLRNGMTIGSAGFHPEEGRKTSSVSLEAARSLGIDLSGHHSQTLTAELLRQFDLVLVMEPAHLSAVAQLVPEASAKTLLLAAFDPSATDTTIADPQGKSRQVFVETYGRVIRCVDELAGRLRAARPDPRTTTTLAHAGPNPHTEPPR
jgi:protein-tyrosine-phosphatase/predicted ATP-grasp superfamily ATP-dependent carboligase